MSPDEVRSFREVTMMLRHMNSRITAFQSDVEESMDELKSDVKDAISAKKQLIYVCMATVIGPAMVAAVKYVLTNG